MINILVFLIKIFRAQNSFSLILNIYFFSNKKKYQKKKKEGGKLVYIKINILGQVVLCSVLVVWGGFIKGFKNTLFDSQTPKCVCV